MEAMLVCSSSRTALKVLVTASATNATSATATAANASACRATLEPALTGPGAAVSALLASNAASSWPRLRRATVWQKREKTPVPTGRVLAGQVSTQLPVESRYCEFLQMLQVLGTVAPFQSHWKQLLMVHKQGVKLTVVFLPRHCCKPENWVVGAWVAARVVLLLEVSTSQRREKLPVPTGMKPLGHEATQTPLSRNRAFLQLVQVLGTKVPEDHEQLWQSVKHRQLLPRLVERPVHTSPAREVVAAWVVAAWVVAA